MQETTEGNGAPCIGGAAQENGLQEAVSCGDEGLRDPQVLDTRIPETSKCAPPLMDHPAPAPIGPALSHPLKWDSS